MGAYFRELKSQSDFKKCVEIQKNIFHLSNDETISTLLLNIYSKELPFTGFSIGAFLLQNNHEKMIGFAINSASFTNNYIYCLMLGVLPEFANTIHGFRLMKELRRISLEKGVDGVYGIFDPLELNLARLYFNAYEFIGLRYQEYAYEIESNSSQDDVPIDKLFFKWDFRKKERLTQNRYNIKDLLIKYPIVDNTTKFGTEKLLYRIPSNFKALENSNPNEAFQIRLESRKILKHLLNELNYNIIDCLTEKINKEKVSYYLFEKQA